MAKVKTDNNDNKYTVKDVSKYHPMVMLNCGIEKATDAVCIDFDTFFDGQDYKWVQKMYEYMFW